MRVGNDTIELVAFDPPGNPLPRPVRSTDPWFQHICLIAPDMQAAMMRLRGHECERSSAVERTRARDIR
jgi:hypothetical protein